MKKTKKNLKGMTLFEIIISIAVLGVLSLVLLTIGVSISNTKMATNKLKNKIVNQSPYAANRVVLYDGTEISNTDMQIQVQISGVSGKYKTLDASGNEVEVEYGVDADGDSTPDPFGPTLDVKGYNTGKYQGTDDEGNDVLKDFEYDGPSLSQANQNLNLKFITFPVPGESEEEP